MKVSDMPFWQEFMLRILWLLGVKPDFVESITIELKAAELPKITIVRSIAKEGEVLRVCDVFTAAKWDIASKGPEQTWEEFKKNLNKIRLDT